MPLEPTPKLPMKEDKSWLHNPEKIEGLVLMLEEKKVDTKTGKERWRYGSGQAFRAMFPTEQTPWSMPYKSTATPATRGSFKVTLKNLEAGKNKFGPEVPKQLVDRFMRVMSARAGSYPIEKETPFWDNPRKLIAAGLVDYCGFTNRQVSAFMKKKFGYDAATPDSAGGTRLYLTRGHEFPYENGASLKLNSPLMISFVDYLRALTGMTLQDVRKSVRQTYGPDSVNTEHIDHFIEAYERYKKEWQSGARVNTSK